MALAFEQVVVGMVVDWVVQFILHIAFAVAPIAPASGSQLVTLSQLWLHAATKSPALTPLLDEPQPTRVAATNPSAKIPLATIMLTFDMTASPFLVLEIGSAE
jgi:hypothetical protein